MTDRMYASLPFLLNWKIRDDLQSNETFKRRYMQAYHDCHHIRVRKHFAHHDISHLLLEFHLEKHAPNELIRFLGLDPAKFLTYWKPENVNKKVHPYGL